MQTGTIARLLIDKGFGFIRDEGGIEHFFHRSSVRGAVFELLREGLVGWERRGGQRERVKDLRLGVRRLAHDQVFHRPLVRGHTRGLLETPGVLAAAGSLNPTVIIGTSIVATFVGTLAAVVAARLLQRFYPQTPAVAEAGS